MTDSCVNKAAVTTLGCKLHCNSTISLGNTSIFYTSCAYKTSSSEMIPNESARCAKYNEADDVYVEHRKEGATVK